MPSWENDFSRRMQIVQPNFSFQTTLKGLLSVITCSGPSDRTVRHSLRPALLGARDWGATTSRGRVTQHKKNLIQILYLLNTEMKLQMWPESGGSILTKNRTP